VPGKDRSCIWCGSRAEYRCLITRAREPNSRTSIRYELCDWHAADIIERLGKLLESLGQATDLYLYRHLAPKQPA
jgi:hypothetical protein